MSEEPAALWEEALMEQEDAELRLKRSVDDELNRLWENHGEDVPF